MSYGVKNEHHVESLGFSWVILGFGALVAWAVFKGPWTLVISIATVVVLRLAAWRGFLPMLGWLLLVALLTVQLNIRAYGLCVVDVWLMLFAIARGPRAR